MAITFNSFSDRARTAIQTAFSIASQAQCGPIEPEVMMQSLEREGRDMVEFVLTRLGVDYGVFSQTLAAQVAALQRSEAGAPHPFSPALEAVLNKSLELSRADGATVVALDHIFQAMAEVPNNVGTLLHDLGVDGQRIHTAIADFHAGASGRRTADNDSASSDRLTRYATDLCALARQERIHPAIGRDTETRAILQILAQKNKCNPVLVGPPGTGKTAIVEGLVCRIVSGDVPEEMRALHVYSLEVSSLTAGAGTYGEFEQRLKDIISELQQDTNAVLFIDEMHLLMGAGGGGMNAANILKPAMARDAVKIIGATTTDEYVRFIEKDSAFERRLQRVDIEEPDVDSCIAIVRGIKQRYEDFHHVKVLDEAVVAAVNLSHRYITDHYLPDKAISLIDEAAARMRINRSSCPAVLDDLRRRIRSKEIERESIRRDDTDDADLPILSAEIDNLKEHERLLNAQWQNERDHLERLEQMRRQLEALRTEQLQAEDAAQYQRVVEIQAQAAQLHARIDAFAAEMTASETTLLKAALDEDDIAQLVTERTGIPVSRLRTGEAERLRMMEQELASVVLGQQPAIHAVAGVVRRSRMGFADGERPIGSFLFLGPTGVGKTELSKALAEFLFDSRQMLVRIDMSEYQQEHTVSRLFGAPPGYVGYDQGGQLTEAVRRKPYSVVLLDEIEKAHPKVFDTLLQVLDDGRMTDGQGRTVNFKNTIIIMTSNAGSSLLLEAQRSAVPGAQEQAREQVMSDLRQYMRPEFINRIDEVICFNALSADIIRDIVEKQLADKCRLLSSSGITLNVEPSAVDVLSRQAYQPAYGARPVKRTIDTLLLNPLTERLIDGDLTSKQPIDVSATGGILRMTNRVEQ